MIIRKITLFLLFLMSFGWGVFAQNQQYTNDSTAVHGLLIKLFEGMREGDSIKVSSVFRKDVRMYSSYTSKENIKVLKEGKLEDFLNAIGSPHEQVWDEKIWNTTIQIDGHIAQVWTDYAFYIGKDFSHCGIDAFQMVKENSGEWKIIHLMDTRRSTDCKAAH